MYSSSLESISKNLLKSFFKCVYSIIDLHLVLSFNEQIFVKGTLHLMLNIKLSLI